MFRITGEDEDIIQVDVDKPIKEVSKDIINQALEFHWGNGQAERHYKVLLT